MQKYSLFIGIDISKNRIDVCFSQNGKRKQMVHTQFSNNSAGFKKMLSVIKKYARKHQLSTWIACMEHTGVYTLPLCAFFAKQKIDYVLDSALRIHRSLGLRRGKSDKADAADIARYLYLHHKELKPYDLPCENLLKIKHLLALRKRLTKAKVGSKVAAGELKRFANPQTVKQVMEYSAQTATHLKKQLKKIDCDLVQIIKSDDQLHQLYQLVTSVKGVGLIVCAYLLVYTNAFTAFQNPRQFACYIGIVPFPFESGDSIKKPDKVSHLANKKLKALISNSAQSAILHDKEIKAYFHRKVEEGKNEFLVKNNVKNKIVKRIFAVVKRRTPYVELYQHQA